MMLYTAALLSLGLLVAAQPLAPVKDEVIPASTRVRVRRAAYPVPLPFVDKDGDIGSEPPSSLVRIKRAAVRVADNVAKIEDQLSGAQDFSREQHFSSVNHGHSRWKLQRNSSWPKTK